MSWVLKESGVEVIKTLNWNPRTFGKITGTSYPAEVEQDYVWERLTYWLGWIDDPEPLPPTVEQRKAEKQSEIDAIEASQYMTRGEREGWLVLFEAQAAQQSVPLDALYAANPFYKKLKDVNTQVTALRAELKAIV